MIDAIKRNLKIKVKFLIKSIQKPYLIIDYLKLYLISNIKRYKKSKTKILKNTLTFVDSTSFVSMYSEIFEKEIYKFKTISAKPYIIDGGANIGLSIIYFKKKYPVSNIVAFEPDKEIFSVLKENIKSFNLDDVEIINKGLWNKEENLKFFSEGADGGRIINKEMGLKENIISTLSLRAYLNKKVDFLKLDIEGAETVVIEDCGDLLINVENIFIEYHSFKNNEQTLDRILKILSGTGFRYYIKPVGIKSEYPFISKNRDPGLDLQLNIYGYKN